MSTRGRRLVQASLLPALLAAAYACAPSPPTAPRVAMAAASPPSRRPPPTPPAWTYWESLDAGVHDPPAAPALPVAEGDVSLVEGGAARWRGLSAAARQALLERGFVEVPRASPGARYGQAYAELAEANVPYVVTLDTLFFVAHVARDRALAAAEDAVLAPALDTLLRRLEVHLGTESRGAPGDLAPGYALARGVVAVALSLLSPAYHPPVDLARAVAEENRRIAAHAGPSVSPLLGVTIDYSVLVPRGAADASSARASYARAVAWLGGAPFVLAARGEADGALPPMSGARAHARAALLLARIVDFEVDAEAANAWHRWVTLAEFAGGKSDDVSLRELLDAAGVAGMDARAPHGFVDVVKLDKMRRALSSGHAPRLDDGSAIAGFAAGRGAGAAFPWRAGASVRLLPARSTVDAEVLQALVYPAVGKLLPRGAEELAPPSARDGVRALPRALDVGAWLGAPEAPALLHDAGDDAYEGYPEQVAALETRRAPEGAKHDSVYLSSLDAIAAYVHPSAADPVQACAGAQAWRLRKLESALTAWVTLRHDALAFARFPQASGPVPLDARARPADGLPAFVEPHPEAIGKLLSVVRQTSRGLRALGHVPGESPATALLDASERLLADAFAVALREANDQALVPEEREAMLTFPGRLLALESALAGSRAADASLAVDVHTDLVAGSALVEAVGDLDDLYLLVREPRSGRLVLAEGAVGSHYEITTPARDRPTDAVWRAPPRRRAARARRVHARVPRSRRRAGARGRRLRGSLTDRLSRPTLGPPRIRSRASPTPTRSRTPTGRRTRSAPRRS